MTVRKANRRDLGPINVIANEHRRELGFVRKVALAESIRRREILVAENSEYVVGFLHYRHRRDQQTTLYNIVVSPGKRRRGIGKRLVSALIKESQSFGKQQIVLKCPTELPANKFYARIGFRRWRKEPGKRRELIVWRLLFERDGS